MKNIYMKREIAALLIAFFLWGAPALNAKPICHGESARAIQELMNCDHTYAECIRELIIKIDELIYKFLDYKENNYTCTWYVNTCNHYLKQMDILIAKGKENAHNAGATKVLADLQKNLIEIRDLIDGYKTKKGTYAPALGNGLDGVTKKLKEIFHQDLPGISLTFEEKLKKAYKYDSISIAAYLNHIRHRLNYNK